MPDGENLSLDNNYIIEKLSHSVINHVMTEALTDWVGDILGD
jgi:hypothetical protein